MKTTQRTLNHLMAGCALAGCLTIGAPIAHAIEGLQVSVQNTNAVLTWPSTNTETFLVQFSSNLTASAAWQTLTDAYPASESNQTVFVDWNSVSYPPPMSGGTNGGGSIDPNQTNNPAGGGTNGFQSTSGFYRVVRDGAYLYATNGTVWSGLVTVPVELGNAFGTAGTMSLTENDDMTGDSIQPAGTALRVDSTQMSNGVHQVSVSTSWSDTNGNYVEADSIPVTVVVSNEISYPDWVPAYGELGNTAVFQAVSAHTNADWQMDVYGSDYNYIGSFGGHTDDGNIQVVWNLVDPDGNVRTNDTFFICQITTWYDPGAGARPAPVPAASSSGSVTPPTYKQNDPWLGPGKFAIAVQHAFDTIPDHELLYDEMSGFTGAANGTFGVLPPQSGDAAYVLPYSDANGSNGDPAAGWAAFKSAVFDPYVRNLVCFGHGGVAGLGHNIAITNEALLVNEISARLHTIPAGQTNIHRFRFVSVDGCSTAKGSMPEAFGIWHKENVPGLDYYNASIRPSCYCGWTKSKSVGFMAGGSLNYGHVNFIAHIQENMLLNNDPIGKAVSDAAKASDVEYNFTTTGDFKIYGFSDLTFGAYNN